MKKTLSMLIALLLSVAQSVPVKSMLGSEGCEMGYAEPYDLPEGVVAVEYLESRAYGRFFAPVPITSENLAYGITIKLVVAIPNAGNNSGLLCQGKTMTSSPWSLSCGASSGACKLYSYGQFQKNFSGAQDRTEMLIEVDTRSVYLTINGLTQGGAYSKMQAYGEKLSILGYGDSNSFAPAGTRLYAFQMYAGGELITDMVAVRVGSEGAMYDFVSGEIVYNAGSLPFIIGPDVED